MEEGKVPLCWDDDDEAVCDALPWIPNVARSNEADPVEDGTLALPTAPES